MFDIGFGELVLVAVIGLLVLGPDRLPGAIRTVALYIGRFRRGFNQIRREIEREIGADDIRRQLHNESILEDINKGKEQLKSLQQDLRQLDSKVRNTGQSVESAVNESINTAIGHGDGAKSDATQAKAVQESEQPDTDNKSHTTATSATQDSPSGKDNQANTP